MYIYDKNLAAIIETNALIKSFFENKIPPLKNSVHTALQSHFLTFYIFCTNICIIYLTSATICICVYEKINNIILKHVLR